MHSELHDVSGNAGQWLVPHVISSQNVGGDVHPVNIVRRMGFHADVPDLACPQVILQHEIIQIQVAYEVFPLYIYVIGIYLARYSLDAEFA